MSETFIFPGSPLDLDKIAASGQCFRWTPITLGSHGAYIVPTAGRCATVYQYGDEVRVHDHTVSGFNIETDAAGRRFWGRYFGADDALGEWWDGLDIMAKREPDAYLTRATRAAAGMRILHQDPFEALISFIISQNNNIPRIKRTIELLCRNLGTHRHVPTARGNSPGAEWWDFPTPEALTDHDRIHDLRLGLGYRIPYVIEAARAVASGELDLEELKLAPYEEARARLKALHGVGDKVADCVCLYGLGHLEAFPIDVHIRRVLEREFPDGFPLDRFTGYAGLVQQLIFYYERKSTTRKEIAIP